MFRPAPLLFALLPALFGTPPDSSGGPPPADDAEADGPEWHSLFDGKTLAGWTPTKFGGEGEVYVEGGRLVLPFGNDLTGVTVTPEVAKSLPTTDYVVALKARRETGGDFFCGLTAPVGKSHATLILGGWGGGVTGLSSLDRRDAVANLTTGYRRFEQNRWYDVRLQITDATVRATLDGEELFAADTRGREVGTRVEVNPSKPFGIATFQTTGAVKDVRWRTLTADEVEAVDAAAGP